MTSDADRWFSPDYATARSRFREAVDAGGGAREVLPLEAKGPAGEELTVDIGWFGAARPEQALLHVCGVHGVEGFAGSAIQLAALAGGEFAPSPGEAMIWVHGLNPYGMAWHRRVNENNVDLNRNFLPASAAYRGSPEHYVRVDELLNPTSERANSGFWLRSLGQILRYGYGPLQQAVTGGQYDYPRGLFFGGEHLEEGPRRYGEWLARTLSGCARLWVIDVHTGLGKSGQDTLLVDAGRDDAIYTTLRSAFGARVMAWDDASAVAYQIRGGHGAGVRQWLPDAGVEFLTQEFGTVSPLTVLAALREENCWHHHGEGHLDHHTKRKLLAVFRPDSARWRRAIVARGQALLRSARGRLAETREASRG